MKELKEKWKPLADSYREAIGNFAQKQGHVLCKGTIDNAIERIFEDTYGESCFVCPRPYGCPQSPANLLESSH